MSTDANAFTYTTVGSFYEGQAGTLIATALTRPSRGQLSSTFSTGTYDLRYSKDNQTPPYNYITSVTIGSEQETITFNIDAEQMPPKGTWFLVLISGPLSTLSSFPTVPITILEAPAAVMCFKKDTKILTFNDEKQQEEYVPIQELKIGTLIKTIHNYGEYKPIVKIKSLKINNGIYAERTKDQLYIANKQSFPQLTEDLIITGAHSILVNSLTEEQKKKIEEMLGEIYITDGNYRLPAWIDERMQAYNIKGEFDIYHIALENDDLYSNYGIFANGLLVESAAIFHLD